MQVAYCPMSIFRCIDASCASTSSCSTFGPFSRSTTSATSVSRRKRWVCRNPHCRAEFKLSRRRSARHCWNDRGEAFRRQRSDANSNHCCAELSAIWNRRSSPPDDMGPKQHGRITIASIPTAAIDFLPRVIQEFNQLYPNIRFRILDLSSNEGLEAVVSGEAEFGINILGSMHPDILLTPLMIDPSCWCAAATTNLRNRRPCHGPMSPSIV